MLTIKQAAFKMHVSPESVRNYIKKGVKDKNGKLIKLAAELGKKGTKDVWHISGDAIIEFQDKFLNKKDNEKLT